MLAGCGNKKKPGKEGEGAAPVKPTPDVVEPTKTDPCAGSAFVLAVSAEIANRDKPASFQTPEFTVVDGAAIRIGDGASYTLFIADYPIERASLGTKSLHPPAGKVLITAMIGGAMPDKPQAPVAKGDVISTTPDESGRAFKLIMERGEDRYNVARDAAGKLEVLAVDDSQICVAVEYSDVEKKSVKGVVRLDVVKM
jgi:hypothetical protein